MSSSTPIVLKQRTYTAVVTATEGRKGRVQSDDGALDLAVAQAKQLGGTNEGTNPEQLFAAGYAACFSSGFSYCARAQKITTGPVKVTASVTIGPAEQAELGFGLAVELAVSAPELPREQALLLLEAAHKICPYSNAVRGNITVDLRLT
ncbi:MAG: organic hydroperoxide resistance protein [Deltaproteobacteria bacterium]|nr:organic hydroperoxide resistance protein [Deltaproteobacteria bacterium]